MARLFEDRHPLERDAPSVLRLRCDPSGPQLFQIVVGSIMMVALVAHFVDRWPSYPGWMRIVSVAILVVCGGVLIGGLYTWLTSWVELDSIARRIVIHRNTLLRSSHDDLPFDGVEAIAIERSHERGVKRIYRLVVRPRRASRIVVSSWQLNADALREMARELTQRVGCRLDEPD